MKKVTMFMMATCPHCAKALRCMDELYNENPAYKSIEVEKIDEVKQPDIAGKYDYYYVPTFYVGDEKLHEGICDIDKVRAVFDAALAD